MHSVASSTVTRNDSKIIPRGTHGAPLSVMSGPSTSTTIATGTSGPPGPGASQAGGSSVSVVVAPVSVDPAVSPAVGSSGPVSPGLDIASLVASVFVSVVVSVVAPVVGVPASSPVPVGTAVSVVVPPGSPLDAPGSTVESPGHAAMTVAGRSRARQEWAANAEPRSVDIGGGYPPTSDATP